jgi:hypothetical protein
MKILLFVISLFLLSSCNKKDDSGWTIFNIKEGSHSSSNALEFTNKSSWNFKFQFDSSAIYKTTDPINQWDVNKLIGLSDDGLHQKNSARFGWRWLNNKLELLAYTHYKGNFEFEKITDIEIGKEYIGTIQYGDEYTFICDGKVVTMRRDKNVPANNYYLWPYFGGDETAPHDIKIRVSY